jgi:hypothetical protein
MATDCLFLRNCRFNRPFFPQERLSELLGVFMYLNKVASQARRVQSLDCRSCDGLHRSCDGACEIRDVGKSNNFLHSSPKIRRQGRSRYQFLPRNYSHHSAQILCSKDFWFSTGALNILFSRSTLGQVVDWRWILGTNLSSNVVREGI